MTMPFLRTVFKYLPSLLFAFALSVAVWISAVTSADPVEERVFPRPVTVELIGQDPGLVLSSDLPQPVTLTLSAPRSIWDRLASDQVAVRAMVDLSGLKAGKATVPVQVQVGIRPVELVAFTPRTYSLALDLLSSRSLPIHLSRIGEPAIGFQAETPALSQMTVEINGPKSAVDQVVEVRAVLTISQAQETLNRLLTLQAVDENGVMINGVNLAPQQVSVTQVITQRGGYRNVVVKVVPQGTVVNGYRLTNITVSPAAVTVFSSDPTLVNNLPGFVETALLNLVNVKEDFDIRLSLNLPKGISVVGDQMVMVQVGVAAIEGSLTFTNNRVEMVGLPEGLSAKVSPEMVDVILSGPLPVLDTLRSENLRVYVDLSGVDKVGTYQRSPQVELRVNDLQVQSILPATIEITITVAATPTPTPTVTPTPRR
jgi:YbbR domain-containing protein